MKDEGGKGGRHPPRIDSSFGLYPSARSELPPPAKAPLKSPTQWPVVARRSSPASAGRTSATRRPGGRTGWGKEIGEADRHLLGLDRPGASAGVGTVGRTRTF